MVWRPLRLKYAMGLLQFGHREHLQYDLPVVVTTFSETLHTQHVFSMTTL